MKWFNMLFKIGKLDATVREDSTCTLATSINYSYKIITYAEKFNRCFDFQEYRSMLASNPKYIDCDVEEVFN